MTKREWCWLVAMVFAVGIFMGVAIACGVYIHCAEAEEQPVYSCWVMCQPDSEVLIRERPNRKSAVVGAVGSGVRMVTDGAEQDGWVHLVDVANETGEGWIYEGYLVYSQPRAEDHQYCVRSEGRVICRRYIRGPRRCWINDGDILTVYLADSEWCLTDKGFVKTEYIDFGSRMDIENMNPDEMTWEED